jgi:hypothetical protein
VRRVCDGACWCSSTFDDEDGGDGDGPVWSTAKKGVTVGFAGEWKRFGNRCVVLRLDGDGGRGRRWIFEEGDEKFINFYIFILIIC